MLFIACLFSFCSVHKLDDDVPQRLSKVGIPLEGLQPLDPAEMDDVCQRIQLPESQRKAFRLFVCDLFDIIWPKRVSWRERAGIQA